MGDAGAGADDRERGGAEEPRVLCDVDSLSADPAAAGGALWRLAEPRRQLDANLIRIPPGGRITPHVEPELDVLVLVVAGSGTLGTEPPQPLTAGSLVWLPRGAVRSLTADGEGLSYVTVHRRRAALQIKTRPPA
ncbi:cupin domain-containing protein [Streptomyces pharetrae]|jgi:quercetin dioxygenase-like cupin family protein|uniref:cupin domain-containing protein n=1 Tax=Streptomyces pharetrae TaxID=291370 RepID=UPI0036646E4B